MGVSPAPPDPQHYSQWRNLWSWMIVRFPPAAPSAQYSLLTYFRSFSGKSIWRLSYTKAVSPLWFIHWKPSTMEVVQFVSRKFQLFSATKMHPWCYKRMQCPKCGNIDLLPKFKCCPECGSRLPRASNASKKVEEGIARSTEQQGTAGNNTVDNGQIQGNHIFFQSWVSILFL